MNACSEQIYLCYFGNKYSSVSYCIKFGHRIFYCKSIFSAILIIDPLFNNYLHIRY